MFKRNTLLSGRQYRSRFALMALAVLLSCLMLPDLFAQTDTGSIVGTVTDTTGAVIQGASVTARNADNGLKLTAVSNAAGEFKILAVPRGNYKVLIAAKGFQSQSAAVTITVTTTQNIPVQLNPAGMQDFEYINVYMSIRIARVSEKHTPIFFFALRNVLKTIQVGSSIFCGSSLFFERPISSCATPA